MKFGRFVLSLASVATLAFGSGSGFFVGGSVGSESAKVTRTQYYSLDFLGFEASLGRERKHQQRAGWICGWLQAVFHAEICTAVLLGE